MLLPPLCPVAKGKKVLFVYILEILDGDRAQSGSFWDVPKKCRHHHPIKPKKPEVTPGIAPVAPKKPEVSPTATLVAQAILKKPDQVEEDAMTGVEPSASTNPPCPRTPLPPSVSSFIEDLFLSTNPFPCEFDHAKILEWLKLVKSCRVVLRDLGAIVWAAGHTDPIRLQCINTLVMLVDLPPPPPFLSATSS
jgi:hypothetical protein